MIYIVSFGIGGSYGYCQTLIFLGIVCL